MRKLITLFLLSISLSGFAQTQINGATQIKDASIPPSKFTTAVGRPANSGVLSTGVLTFDAVSEIFTKTVSADLALSLASSGNIAYSQIILTLTGDGTHVVTWPTSWEITGAYNVNATQDLTLDYNGTTVVGKFSGAVDIVEIEFVEGVVDSGTPDKLNLTFDGAVTITSDGWTLEADGAAVDFIGVSGSGTATPFFTLVRDIIGDEVLTLSYNTTTGSTTSLTGNELETITDAAITGFPATPPVGDFDLYVDDDATDDVAAGTIGDPYKTIQAASNAAIAGQVIGVRAGTYRETIVAKTGVSYEEYPTETAIISGLEIIANTGWTVHSGNIYKKTITLPVNGFNTSTSRVSESVLNTTIFANQLFRNGTMMVEARYPNIAVGVTDLLDRAKYRNGIIYNNGFNTTNLTDASFPVAAPGLIGATLISNGWISQESRTITNHTSNTVYWTSAIWGTGGTNDWHRKRFYITGKLALLNAEGEFHYESGTLYFWQPGAGTISGTVEYKARNWGFDIRDKQNVTIKGLNFVGCEVARGNVNSSSAVIDGVTAYYQNHHVRHDVVEWQGVGMSKQFGTMLIGPNSIVKNSEIAYGGSQQFWLGENGRFENNTMHDVGYVGYWANGVSPWADNGGLKILRNTFSGRFGRSCFDFGYDFHYGDQAGAPAVSRHFNIEVAYNDMSGWNAICQDGGATYAWGQNDLWGLDYHHNWIHEGLGENADQVGLNCGIYFDQAAGPGKIHHNVVWLATVNDMYHEVTNPTRPYQAGSTWTRPNPSMDVYNNTFATTSAVFPRSYITYEPAPFDKQRNNIYISQIIADYGSDIANSVLPGTNPQFVATGAGGLYYRPGVASPAIGIGVNNYAGVTGTITDASTTAGAYIYNDPDPWTAGATAVVESGLINDNDPDITYSTSQWTYANHPVYQQGFTNGDIHVTSVQGATATYVFTGTEISVTSQKCDNMGIVRFEIFDDAQNDNVYDDQIGADVDVDLYINTGGTAQDYCPNGQRMVVFNVSGLTAGDKMIKMTLQTQDNGAVPAKNTFVFDDLLIE